MSFNLKAINGDFFTVEQVFGMLDRGLINKKQASNYLGLHLHVSTRVVKSDKIANYCLACKEYV